MLAIEASVAQWLVRLNKNSEGRGIGSHLKLEEFSIIQKKYIQEVLEMPAGLKGGEKEVFLERLSTMAVKKLEFSLHLSVLYLIN